MKDTFWQELKKPIMVLAPMADVTDAAFRRIIAKYGKPDVTFTEFVSTDGLLSIGRDHLLHNLWFTDAERPIVAQIFGNNPEYFYRVALMLQELGFDGIDINMGCPERNIVKQGSCAALIQEPELAQKIILECKRGASRLPVSVKTRIGFNQIETDRWIPRLLEVEPAAITVHGRTKKEMSDVPAHWDEIAKTVKMRHSSGSRTLIIGNGDVATIEEAHEKAHEYGVDGVMLGRAIFGNPWLFHTPNSSLTMGGEGDAIITVNEKLKVMLEHTVLFEQLFVNIKNFAVMKKHYKAYVSGFDDAKNLRVALMTAKSASEVAVIVDNFLGEKMV